MRNEAVTCHLGPAWWFWVSISAALVGMGGLVLLGALDWMPATLAYACVSAGLLFLVFQVGMWRRFRADRAGLVIESVVRRRLVPWPDVARPYTYEILTPEQITYDLDPEKTPSGLPQFFTVLRDVRGRVVGRIGPLFTNRTAFMIALHRRLREADAANGRRPRDGP